METGSKTARGQSAQVFSALAVTPSTPGIGAARLGS